MPSSPPSTSVLGTGLFKWYGLWTSKWSFHTKKSLSYFEVCRLWFEILSRHSHIHPQSFNQYSFINNSHILIYKPGYWQFLDLIYNCMLVISTCVLHKHPKVKHVPMGCQHTHPTAKIIPFFHNSVSMNVSYSPWAPKSETWESFVLESFPS